MPQGFLLRLEIATDLDHHQLGLTGRHCSHGQWSQEEETWLILMKAVQVWLLEEQMMEWLFEGWWDYVRRRWEWRK